MAERRRMPMGLLDPESERIAEAYAALPSVKKQTRGLLSLEPQPEQSTAQTAFEMLASFIPGVGQALAARDIERARRANDPTAAAIAATEFLPFGRLAGLGKKAGPVMSEIDVYHGSPHRFEKFDASKIGTGEGAQAYGHGIYVAESPDVAKGYARGVKDIGAIKAMNDEMSQLAKVMAQDEVVGQYRKYKTDAGRNAAKRYDELMSQRQKAVDSPGNLYTADLPDEMVDRMLDWDKRISDQPEFVQKAWADWRATPQAQKLVKQMTARGSSAQDIEKMFANPTGETMHKWIYEGFGSAKGGEMPKVASFLKDKGLLGVKYQDAGSRGQGGTGTRNFVVFPGEEKKVKIKKRE